MKFFWKEIDYNKYLIIYATSPDSKVLLDTTLIVQKTTGLKKDLYENFLRKNGAKKSIDGKFYFKNKNDIQNVVDQLNSIKKLCR